MELKRLGIRRRGFEQMSQKLYLDFCYERVFGDKNTLDWLVAKNLILSGKVVEGLLNNDMKVVIKIGTDKGRIDKEYDISKQLSVFHGFVRYICKFSCKDDLRKYSGNWTPDVGFCDLNGPDKTNSIIMPYYPLGSMLKYKWTRDTFDTFKKLLKSVVEAYLVANEELGFVHNDFHLDNLLLKESKYSTFDLKVDIIDFELSEINEKYKKDKIKIGRDFKKIFTDLLNLDFVTADSIAPCLIFADKMRDPFETVHTADVFKLIDDLKFVNYDYVESKRK